MQLPGEQGLVSYLSTNQAECANNDTTDRADMTESDQQEQGNGNSHSNGPNQNEGTIFVTVDAIQDDLISWDGDLDIGSETNSYIDDAETVRADNNGQVVEEAHATEGSLSQACQFLENIWSSPRRLYNPLNCDKEQCQYAKSLRQMVLYWKDLGVPDAIRHSSDSSLLNDIEQAQCSWSSILSGGDERPRLSFKASEEEEEALPGTCQTWDVDSIICWADCLSVNRGLYISYTSPISRNIQTNVHIFHQRVALHKIPHLRLGHGHQSPQFSVYIFFPNVRTKSRVNSYLKKEERRLWVDELLLPAIRTCCPTDLVQHHPRSFDDVETKAHSRRRETFSRKLPGALDMHYYIPPEYLESIWCHMVESTDLRPLAMFRSMFIVLSGKNIKLECRSDNFEDSRRRTIDHLQDVLDWSKADLNKTWVDVGKENTVTDLTINDGYTLLWKRRYLEEWIEAMKHSAASPRIASEIFTWNLTQDAGSARVELLRSHNLREGGILYAQKYNISKDLFTTVSQKDHTLFGEPRLEGMTCPPSLMDAWIVAGRHQRNSGLATAQQSRPQIKQLRKAFEAMRCRLNHALISSSTTGFGSREEYRISWNLFTRIVPRRKQPTKSRSEYWLLPTIHVNAFMRWEFNRWIFAIDVVRARSMTLKCGWEDQQRNMIMMSILLRCLKASVNCHHLAKRSQLFKASYQNKRGEQLRGLDFEQSLRQSGLAWLPSDMFRWSTLCLLDELVTVTTFTFNGLQGSFPNWDAVKTISREYGLASDLEKKLQHSNIESHCDVLDEMRNMIYRHLAAHVIQLLPAKEGVHPTTLAGYHGLSYDIVVYITGAAPYLTNPQTRRQKLGSTYVKRIQCLFEWDDGIERTYWDPCFFRQLVRRFFCSISQLIGSEEAYRWKLGLGQMASRHFWIIPQFDKHSLFIRGIRKEPGATRPFIPGTYQFGLDEHKDEFCDENKWSIMKGKYMIGWPIPIGNSAENSLEPRQATPFKPRRIDFGCEVPFTAIPSIIEEGFQRCERTYEDIDQRTVAHYRLAQECLLESLGDPLCDLLLMLVLTLSASTEAPSISCTEPLSFAIFEPGARRNPRIFAATLTIRMLWFLRPGWFPWVQNANILSVPEMLRAVEHRGVPNRVLCKVGWLVSRSNRINPRLVDLELCKQETLLQYREDLIKDLGYPESFILRVFQSQDKGWIDPCLSIVD